MKRTRPCRREKKQKPPYTCTSRFSHRSGNRQICSFRSIFKITTGRSR